MTILPLVAMLAKEGCTWSGRTLRTAVRYARPFGARIHPCRTYIRGEALEHKQREQRGGRR